MDLEDLGWSAERTAAFAAAARGRTDVHPGRIAVEYNHMVRVFAAAGEWDAVVSGRLKHKAARRADLPAVGDWVVVRRRADEDRASVLQVLPRRGVFSRKVAGTVTDEQVIAANLDVAFVVSSLDADFSLRRLERYLLLAREGQVRPVVVLTKPDRADDVAARTAEAAVVAGDAPVFVMNPRTGAGVEQLAPLVGRGVTCAVLGSSGVGKSTLVNRLVGHDLQRTQEVRIEDAKGRHTTTHRQLVQVPTGGWLLDTPGMRELQLWEGAEGVQQAFDDVEGLAAGCHFTDCRHRDEPRCAVKAAVERGVLAADRLGGYLAVQEELRTLAAQQTVRARIDDRRRAKVQTKALTARLRAKGRHQDW